MECVVDAVQVRSRWQTARKITSGKSRKRQMLMWRLPSSRKTAVTFQVVKHLPVPEINYPAEVIDPNRRKNEVLRMTEPPPRFSR